MGNIVVRAREFGAMRYQDPPSRFIFVSPSFFLFLILNFPISLQLSLSLSLFVSSSRRFVQTIFHVFLFLIHLRGYWGSLLFIPFSGNFFFNFFNCSVVLATLSIENSRKKRNLYWIPYILEHESLGQRHFSNRSSYLVYNAIKFTIVVQKKKVRSMSHVDWCTHDFLIFPVVSRKHCRQIDLYVRSSRIISKLEI